MRLILEYQLLRRTFLNAHSQTTDPVSVFEGLEIHYWRVMRVRQAAVQRRSLVAFVIY